MRERWCMTAEIEADTKDDLAAKLNDLATDLIRDQVPVRQVFGGPSCSGIVRLEQQEVPDAKSATPARPPVPDGSDG